MRAVDTNLVVRLIVRDNPEQVVAAETFIAKGAWVSHLVLAETLWVLDAAYERSAEQLATAVEMLLNHKALTLQDADVVVAALDLFRARPTIGFSDCLVLEIARKAGHLPLGTFDKALAKHSGAEQVQ
ncbi:MAG: PIN domain-containing protein [Steroidobacteraceae bacterium]